MKRILLFAVAAMLCTGTANAQLGGLLQRAAKKATEKAVSKVEKEAEKKIDEELDKKSNSSDKREITSEKSDEMPTYGDLMAQMPEMPSDKQYVSYKEAELNDQTMKMTFSPVARFNLNVVALASQASTLAYQNIDSAQANEMAYKYAEASTGMSRTELEAMKDMSDEEQQAYIQAHYRQGKAEENMMKQAGEVSQAMEPLQPLIDKWSAIGDKADKVRETAEEQIRGIYKKYAPKLATAAAGKERNKVLVEYYTEILPIVRKSVTEAMEIRLKEQLPVAMELESRMVEIRAKYQDVYSALMNYPQLTATTYFSEVARMTEIPEFIEE